MIDNYICGLNPAVTSTEESEVWVPEGSDIDICASIELVDLMTLPPDGVNVTYELLPIDATFGEGRSMCI